MRVKIECLPEPKLAFGEGKSGLDPRRILSVAGPVDAGQLSEIKLALVGPQAEVAETREWLAGLNRFRAARESNSQRYRDWPGAGRALGVQFVIYDRFVRPVDQTRFEQALERSVPRERFDDLLELFDGRIQGLIGDNSPDVIVVCLPEEVADLRIANPGLSEPERRALERLRLEEESDQLNLFTPTPEELKAAEELRTQADDLLFKTFYRALKARTMQHQNPIPLQVIRHETVTRPDDKGGHSHATRSWNLGTSLYYKAGGLPWRPADLPDNVCFIGISFHHLKRRSDSLVYASVAQAFSTSVEPFTLKGETIDQEQRRDKQPYLRADQAAALMKDVLDHYEARAGILPSRVVIHKTTMYQPEEEEGFLKAAHDRVPACSLVWMRSTPFRLIRKGKQEPWRGTLCTVGDETYLYTSGYVPWWNEYPGPHIPAPIQLGVDDPSQVRDRAMEVLALSKMNWNTTEGMSRYPITVSFAKKVGQLMSEFSDNQVPNPSYRFYM